VGYAGDIQKFFILGKLLKFNGGLFANPEALPLTDRQLKILHSAATKAWSEVQPAIFGTLIERALDEKERHNLGAHFTPESYVNRVLRPAIEAPLRDRWDGIRAQVRQLVPPNEEPKRSEVKKAQDLVLEFHEWLCELTILDPACGSGNFLYLAMNMLKRLESEVLGMLHDLGVRQLDLTTQTVTPRQFKGLEIRLQSKEIAELVLWIGYLQWHYKMYGQTKNPPEPILRDYKNIECRDAILEWDDRAPRPSACRPAWPSADFVVGNPPFIGNKRMRSALGDAYVEALRATWDDVPDSADLVMYWWSNAATLLRERKIKRFGMITTNSFRQSFNRRVVERHMGGLTPLRLAFAIPDHPWIDTREGADVRVAMTVGTLDESPGTVVDVREGDGADLAFPESIGIIGPDLSIGADLTKVIPLDSNAVLSSRGVIPHGEGMVLTQEQAKQVGLGSIPGLEKHVRPYRNGRDLTQKPRNMMVIDLYPLSEREVLKKFPAVYQWLVQHVKPERDKQKDKDLREKWWLHRRNNEDLRQSLHGLERYIATVQTSKHRFFTFLSGAILPDDKLIAVASDDAWILGVLSSRVHVAWALATGSRLGVGNDPVYNKTTCFEAFPFPTASEKQKARIRAIAEDLDEHRKRVLAADPSLTMTGMYNVLDRVRKQSALSDLDQKIFNSALITVLKKLHDDLDESVLKAYGWAADDSDQSILSALAALNRTRAAEEAGGTIAWLRPEFQKARTLERRRKEARSSLEPSQLTFAWPDSLPEQVTTVRTLLGASQSALSAKEVAMACTGASSDKVIPVLETLEALGHLVSFKDKERRWASLARVANERGPGLRRASSRPPAPAEVESA